MVQNSITNASERKLVVAQIRRAKRVISAYKKCASDFEVDIRASDRYQHRGDTWGLSLQVSEWELLVASYDATESFVWDGTTSLFGLNKMAYALIVSRGGQAEFRNELRDAEEGRLSLKRAQEILTNFGVSLRIQFQYREPEQQEPQAAEEVTIFPREAAG